MVEDVASIAVGAVTMDAMGAVMTDAMGAVMTGAMAMMVVVMVVVGTVGSREAKFAFRERLPGIGNQQVPGPGSLLRTVSLLFCRGNLSQS